MKHRVAGRKLGRSSSHRLALLRNLASALFQRERITTTLHKAKELRPFAEKLITLAKRETLHARRQVLRHIHDRDLVAKLFEIHSARYAQRPGGYLRIVKLGPRRGDNAEMAIIEMIGAEPIASSKKKGAGKGKKAPAAEPAPEKAAPEAAPSEPKKGERAPRKKAAPKAGKKKSEAKPARKAKPAPAAKKAAAKPAPRKATPKSKKGGN